MNQSANGEVGELVAHLFRHKAGEVISILTKIFGFENFDLAEDVVQETLVKALQQWPFSGVPKNPAGWILSVAKNQALDILRRNTRFREKHEELARILEQRMRAPSELQQFEEEQLTLMFTCCHPAFTPDLQVTLILKTLCGFSVAEIARALLLQQSAAAQRIVRAKRRIEEERIRFEMPEERDLPARLDTVLKCLYLMFNEGYAATEGDDLVRHDLCQEAIRLASLLLQNPAVAAPKTHALLALMLFQASRLNARTNKEGELMLLEEQDRALWDRNLIQLAMFHLDRAAQGNELSKFHIEAGIASCHATAADYESTDWQQILQWYEMLMEFEPSPVVLLNRAVAVSMVHGPEAALQALQPLLYESSMSQYYLLPATLADLHRRLGHMEEAILQYQRTLQLARTEPERRFVMRKLDELTRSAHPNKPVSNTS